MSENTRQIIIIREFDAPVEKVWEAWTNPDLVKEWWGPKDFYSPSISIDFRVGGKYIFAMHGPKGTPFDKDMYSGGIYREIVPNEKLVMTDFFCDEEGNKVSPTSEGMDPHWPDEMSVTVHFERLGEMRTKLTIEYEPTKSDAEFEMMKKSGMNEGWSSSLDKLAHTVEMKGA